MGLTVKGTVFYIKICLLLTHTYMPWVPLIGQGLLFPSRQGKESSEEVKYDRRTDGGEMPGMW